MLDMIDVRVGDSATVALVCTGCGWAEDQRQRNLASLIVRAALHAGSVRHRALAGRK